MVTQVESIVDLIYPVGSIYMNYSSSDPNTLFAGTTWVQIKDRFLLAQGDTYTTITTGGAATVTLATENLPSHTHGLNGHTHTYTDYYATTTGGNSGSTGGNSGNTSSTRINFSNGEAQIGFKDGGGVLGLRVHWTAYNATHGQTLGQWDTSQSVRGVTLSGYQDHTHTHNGHTHSLNGHTHTGNNTSTTRTSNGNSGDTTSTGSGTAFSILPPYQTVYVWRRTA